MLDSIYTSKEMAALDHRLPHWSELNDPDRPKSMLRRCFGVEGKWSKALKCHAGFLWKKWRKKKVVVRAGGESFSSEETPPMRQNSEAVFR